ncbi:heparinase II/III domain-containing protein [Maribellus sediminis]|uniref:heparinase II/III domain-containing protein n=1 Tax=Maribellus sediminis TaxID=2696285 RepID=UPI001431D78A|nr:heparinase II/III family protein [Maribellus sediminis]
MSSKNVYRLLLIFVFLFKFTNTFAEDLPKLDNPMSLEYLKKNLRKSQPRLVLNRDLEKDLKKKLKTDPVLQNMYAAIQLNAESIFDEELLTRKMVGRRLLGTSREMLYRINMLAFVYRIEKDQQVLQRINDEVLAVCAFSDWNPSHFLDVAEMSLAVALALDWTAGDLPPSTIKIAKQALVEKGLNPSWPDNEKPLWWTNGDNNWNQVCNGGMIAAAITVAEDEPELAARTIARALDGLPNAMAAYLPDGVYPEGSTYWDYGTSFSVTIAAMLESAFGNDFGHWDFPGFKESAVFRVLTNAPSGMYYNFADCGDSRSENGDLILAWFAMKSGNETFYERSRFLQPADKMEKQTRLAGVSLVWLSQFEKNVAVTPPTAWKGEGHNPIAIFTGGENDPHGYYLGTKGGRGMVNHGNMDGGSFVFELNGVRWVVDPGNQDYNTLEQAGFDLWNKGQKSQRWTLLTKSNFGHSTISINDSLHRTDGLVTITDFEDGDRPLVSYDMSATLGDVVAKAARSFTKDSPVSVLIEDEIVKSDKTELITWQLMTTADVEIVEGGALLKKDGKTLKLENLSHPDISVSLVSLDPAPLKLDRQIPGLKRIELRIPAWTIGNDEVKIKVRLSGE